MEITKEMMESNRENWRERQLALGEELKRRRRAHEADMKARQTAFGFPVPPPGSFRCLHVAGGAPATFVQGGRELCCVCSQPPAKRWSGR